MIAHAGKECGPTLEQIQTLSSLAILKVNVADAFVTELAGKTGEIKTVLVVHGSATLGVDLSKARFESVDQRNRTAVLVLPSPRIQTLTLDHEKTRVVWLCESGLWNIVPGGREADAAAANMAYAEAQQSVARAASDPNSITRARTQTEQIVTAFFEAISWRLKIHWLGESRSS